MADEIVLSPNGKKKIEEEHYRLKNTEMPALAERIRPARALGDLSENFDYQDAKRQQGFIAGKIADLQAILERARIEEETPPGSDIVGMGATVTLRDLDEDEEFTITIVGDYEADPDNDLISFSSPMGKALIGCRPGVEVSVAAAGGTTRYEILAIA